jgi:2-desacetyl-2-hydroxyethyl bacteriochlorophyllide A dehydrogenase
MKAIIYDRYGPPEVLQVKEVPEPIPGDKEILIRISAASVNYGDLIARHFNDVKPSQFNMPFLFWFMAKMFFGWNRPKIKILGSEFSGEVAAMGKSVEQFKKGDQVFGYLGQAMGTYAEYLCLPEKAVVTRKPVNMTHEEAATIPSGSMTALSLLDKVNIQKGQKVLINGASGGIGSIAVQLAKNLGAEVTGVCSTNRVEFVRSLGADQVIDYTQKDFTQNSEKYDLIFDVLGKSSFSRSKKSLTENGRYLRASFKSTQLFQMFWTSLFSRKKVICALSPQKTEDLEKIRDLIEAGKIKSIVDKRFPLEQAAEAHRYAEGGHKKGNIVIRLK